MSNVIEINSWDAWEDRISDTVEFRNGAVTRRFKVYSVSAGEQEMIARELEKALPAKPKRRVNHKTGIADMNDPNYDKAIMEWEEKARPAAEIATMRWIECGWAKPNGITIPGETPKEQLENLKKKVAGDIQKLRAKIEVMSNLNEENIDFFSLNSAL